MQAMAVRSFQSNPLPCPARIYLCRAVAMYLVFVAANFGSILLDIWLKALIVLICKGYGVWYVISR